MKYFNNCKTAEELKKEYRKLVMKLHPDIIGGDGEGFNEMRNEYEKLWERLKNVHANSEGKTYTATKKTEETPQNFIHIINVLIILNDIEVETCGSWVRVSGDTQQHREVLKQLNFKWAHKKQAWYYHTEPYKKRSNRELTLDEIRDMFGSQKYEAKEEKQPVLQG